MAWKGANIYESLTEEDAKGRRNNYQESPQKVPEPLKIKGGFNLNFSGFVSLKIEWIKEGLILRSL